MLNAIDFQTLLSRLTQRIVRLPRGVRIVLVALFSIALTLLVTPVVDAIYSSRFYDPGTLMVPTIISTGLGIVFYLVGWRLMIGYAGETPRPGSVMLGYFVLGVLICAIVLVLVITGAVSGTST